MLATLVTLATTAPRRYPAWVFTIFELLLLPCALVRRAPLAKVRLNTDADLQRNSVKCPEAAHCGSWRKIRKLNVSSSMVGSPLRIP